MFAWVADSMGRPAAITLADWTEQAINVIEKLARSQSTVTAEDLRKHFEAPEHQNMIGSAFRVAYHQKIITPVGYRASTDKSRRAGALRVWELHPRLKEAG